MFPSWFLHDGSGPARSASVILDLTPILLLAVSFWCMVIVKIPWDLKKCRMAQKYYSSLAQFHYQLHDAFWGRLPSSFLVRNGMYKKINEYHNYLHSIMKRLTHQGIYWQDMKFLSLPQLKENWVLYLALCALISEAPIFRARSPCSKSLMRSSPEFTTSSDSPSTKLQENSK